MTDFFPRFTCHQCGGPAYGRFCSYSCWRVGRGLSGEIASRLITDEAFAAWKASPQLFAEVKKRKAKPAVVCIACGDTGKNSSGGPCRPCVIHGRNGAARLTSPSREASDESDEEGYRHRKQIADEMNEELKLAKEAVGEAKQYGVHVIRDKMGIEPERRIYCCRYAGRIGWSPSVEEAFPRWNERQPNKFVDNPITGERSYYFRFELGTSSLDKYNPLPPEELKKRRSSREAKKRAKEVRRYALFADEVQQVQEVEAVR